jgi:hypothetical protein
MTGNNSRTPLDRRGWGEDGSRPGWDLPGHIICHLEVVKSLPEPVGIRFSSFDTVKDQKSLFRFGEHPGHLIKVT